VTLIHATTATDVQNALNLKIETLCKEGNMELGGLDWDRALVEIVAEKMMQQYSVNVREDPKNEPALFDNCERAKRHLSRTNDVKIVADPAGHEVEVSVVEFEDRTHDLVLKTQMLLEQVLDDARKEKDLPDGTKRPGIPKEKIDVILSGGATKMPMVRKMIEDVMGKPPLQHGNPELLVTIGAAYWAHLIEGKSIPIPKPDEPEKKQDLIVQGLTDVSAYSVGIEVLEPNSQGGFVKVNRIILPKGTLYGSEAVTRVFSTSHPGMTEIPIVLYKGESEKLDECERLAEFTIVDLPSDRPEGQPVEVTLGYDGSGIIHGTAKDVNTTRYVEIIENRRKTT
jgi:molecular chaperone DnaK